MKLVIRPAARADILSQVTYLLDESAFQAASLFPEAAHAAIQWIRRNRTAGALQQHWNPRLKGLRSWPVPGFEDVRVYYLQPDQDTILILRILHGKRDLRRILIREHP